MNFNINKCVAVTGHRILPKNFDKERLLEIFNTLINNGYDTFLIGMALGFDTLCFNLLTELKNSYKHIKLVAVVPCKNQDRAFNIKQKEEYKKMIFSADEVIVLNEEYITGCMQERNRFLVDNSSILVAYLTKNNGGTYYTVNYARKKEKEIVILD
ncbi:MAG: DUF1273 domain-containing protein [Clostridiales bacterium]|nr:DUF1273 domain-containing protein [Clostridiales bacterium]